MRPLLVVIAPPGLQYGTGVRQRAEQRLVQQLVAQPAVEAFDEAVLLRLARRDVMPADAGRIRPAQDRVRGQLGAIVADDRVRASLAPSNDAVEFPRRAPPGDRGVGDQRQTLPGAVVDNRQDPEAAAVGQLVVNEVQAPALVGASGTSSGRRVPIARLRPPRRRTVSRSSR